MVPNRQHFIDDLAALNNKVSEMGNDIISAYKTLIKACEDKDNKLAKRIMEDDKFINELEIAINVDAYLIIAKQCPVASDLRRIITALKISNDLERIGDYASNTAKYLLETTADNTEFLDIIIALTTRLIGMLEGIMKAFNDEDIKLALAVNELDELLDEEYKGFVKKLIKITKTNTDEDAEEAVRAILIIKQLERAGDHVTNIAENIVYLVNGKRVELN